MIVFWFLVDCNNNHNNNSVEKTVSPAYNEVKTIGLINSQSDPVSDDDDENDNKFNGVQQDYLYVPPMRPVSHSGGLKVTVIQNESKLASPSKIVSPAPKSSSIKPVSSLSINPTQSPSPSSSPKKSKRRVFLKQDTIFKTQISIPSKSSKLTSDSAEAKNKSDSEKPNPISHYLNYLNDVNENCSNSTQDEEFLDISINEKDNSFV